ncbi:Fe-S cluster assembly protein SufD [Pyruvatibacter sp. HU-CL02332]|uniref:Fe-S cluster assembly protein SufD n=1 Tax=Pyruvatibacter sp. HU-CL02332 TaxID=3127650 RepID=UPI0031029CA7
MARVAVQPLDIETGLVDDHAAAAKVLPGAAYQSSARSKAIEAFAVEGLPNRRLEEYRYFDLRQMLAKAGPLAVTPAASSADTTDPATDIFAEIDRHIAVFINGRFDTAGSSLNGLPDGVELLSYAEALNSEAAWVSEALESSIAPQDAVATLNAAYAIDGVVIRVSAGVKVDKPIEVQWRAIGDVSTHFHTRSLVVLEEGAQLTLLETRGDDEQAPVFSTGALRLVVGDDASLRHATVCADGEDVVRVGKKSVTLGKASNYETLGLAVGAGKARTDEHLHFAGENTKASISGLSLLRDAAVMDNTLFVDHAVPNCESEETFRSVLDDASRGVFQGSILVRKDAQKIDSQMQARALLLSRKAEMDAKPMLEIYADDVICAHGSAIGEPDQNAIFYLMSRGIDENTARALLVAGFLDDVVDGFDDGEIAVALKTLLAERLGAPKDTAQEASL